MKVYNKEKTEVLETYDLTKGFLKTDKILKVHHEAVPAAPAVTVASKIEAILTNGGKVIEVDGIYYEVVKEFPNGGRTLEEIEETPGVPKQEAYDEYEDIMVYIPYTEQEIKAQEKIKKVLECKKYLADTDYIVLKIGECLADGNTEEVAAIKTKYAEQLAKRKEARDKINELEVE